MKWVDKGRLIIVSWYWSIGMVLVLRGDVWEMMFENEGEVWSKFLLFCFD